MSIAVFWFFAVILIAFALAVVISTNIVHSSFYLIAVFFSVACMFILLKSDFLAMMQIWVYVGAISVIVVFAVMLTRKGNISESNLFNRRPRVAFFVSLIIFVQIALSALATPLLVNKSTLIEDHIKAIANALLHEYIIAFEIAGLLLLVAVIGAVIVAKNKDSE